MEEVKKQGMESLFVPYEIALALKELGFDEPCFKVYDTMGFLQEESVMNICEIECNCVLERCLAPLYSQAFKFFREKHELLNHTTTHLNPYGEDGALEESYGYRIMLNKDGWKCEVWEMLSKYDTIEEAELECLKKLIEICKKN